MECSWDGSPFYIEDLGALGVVGNWTEVEWMVDGSVGGSVGERSLSAEGRSLH